MSLTRSDLARKIAGDFGMPVDEAKRIVDGIFLTIGDRLSDGDDVMLSKFGKFTLRDTPERMGRNPRTGEPAVVTARKRLSFKPASQLQKRLNEKV